MNDDVTGRNEGQEDALQSPEEVGTGRAEYRTPSLICLGKLDRLQNKYTGSYWDNVNLWKSEFP